MKHPNAAVGGGTSALSLIVVWVLGYLGVPLSAEAAVVVAGSLTTVALFVGRNGIAGIARMVWRGSR